MRHPFVEQFWAAMMALLITVVALTLVYGCGKSGANYTDCKGTVVCYDDECHCTIQEEE